MAAKTSPPNSKNLNNLCGFRRRKTVASRSKSELNMVRTADTIWCNQIQSDTRSRKETKDAEFGNSRDTLLIFLSTFFFGCQVLNRETTSYIVKACQFMIFFCYAGFGSDQLAVRLVVNRQNSGRQTWRILKFTDFPRTCQSCAEKEPFDETFFLFERQPSNGDHLNSRSTT